MVVDIFCGIRDPVCHTANKAKYAIARGRVAHDFLFVGTLERLDESLRLMQHQLPTFFEGVAVRSFARLRANHGAKSLDPKPSLRTIREVSAQLHWDMRLFAFIDRLLDQRLRACNITAV
jgi:hypothetical protein